MITEENVLRIAKQWVNDWNQHDLDAILSHYAEEINFTSPIVVKLLGNANGNIQGKNALRSYFAKGLSTYPDLKFEVLQILTSVNSVVIYYRSVQDRLAAEFMAFNQQGLVAIAVAHYSSPV